MGDPGSETLAERRGDEARRRHDVAHAHLRSRAEPDLRADRQSAAGDRGQGAARATICSPRRWSRSIPIPGRWSGISSLRRTTRTTGTPRRRRSCSMARSTGSSANCWRRPAATATSSCSIAPTARTLSSTEYVKTNWAKGVDAKGSPIPDPAKEPQLDGALVSPNQGGADQLAAAHFQPGDRAVLCERVARLQRVLHLRSERQARRAGAATIAAAGARSMIQAIDYKTGKVKWSSQVGGWRPFGAAVDGGQPALRRRWLGQPGGAGSGQRQSAVACQSGRPVSNGPITYELDGTQYLVVGAGDTLFGFAMLK